MYSDDNNLLEALDANQFKDTTVDPYNVIACMNPRPFEELALEPLIPAMEATDGINTEKVMIWKLPPDSPIWNEFVGDYACRDLHGNLIGIPPVEERAKKRIALRGHRRMGVGLEFKENPRKYAAACVENASKMRAVEVTGISFERAEDLALDEEAKKNLSPASAIVICGKDFRRDKTWQQIVMEKTQLLFRAFYGADKGEILYEAAMKIHEASKRKTAIQAKLRNYVDAWVQTAFLIGEPLWEQLNIHFKFVRTKRDLPEGTNVLLDCKLDNMRKRLRPIYSNANSNDWEDVDLMKVYRNGEGVPKEVGPNETLRTKKEFSFHVRGGNLEMREELVKLMQETALDETPGGDDPKPPSKADQGNVIKKTRSKVGKAFCNFFSGTPQSEEGESRQALEHWALDCEARDQKLAAIRDKLEAPLQAVVDSLVKDRNVDKIEECFLVVNEMIKPKKPAKK